MALTEMGGIVRSLDNLGRIVIPQEMRRVYGWTDGTPLEILPVQNHLVIRTPITRCVICSEPVDTATVRMLHGRSICMTCTGALIED